MLIDVVEPQRVDVVEWLKLAVWIPPAVRQFLEFGDLG
jgi:hypothetical protein